MLGSFCRNELKVAKVKSDSLKGLCRLNISFFESDKEAPKNDFEVLPGSSL